MLCCRIGCRNRRVLWPEGSAANPFGQRVEFLGGQRVVGRHLAASFATDRQQQFALIELLRVDDRTVVAFRPLAEIGCAGRIGAVHAGAERAIVVDARLDDFDAEEAIAPFRDAALRA